MPLATSVLRFSQLSAFCDLRRFQELLLNCDAKMIFEKHVQPLGCRVCKLRQKVKTKYNWAEIHQALPTVTVLSSSKVLNCKNELLIVKSVQPVTNRGRK